MVRVLPAEYASEVRDIILRPPEALYTALKTELKQRVSPSKRQRLQELLHVEGLGDRKPSQLLRQMLKLRGGTVPDGDKDEIFRELFLQKLPITVRTALAIHKDVSLTRVVLLSSPTWRTTWPRCKALKHRFINSRPMCRALNHTFISFHHKVILKLLPFKPSCRRSGKHCSPSPDQRKNNNVLPHNLPFVGITSDLARKL